MERPRLTVLDSPLLSIVIPAFNEASRITATLERVTAYLRERAISAEVLVIDDGSVDDTVDLAEAFAGSSPPVRTIWLAHRGKGAAVKAGMLLAKGEYRFLCDADLSMPIEQIERFLDRIDRFDIVIGSREAAGARRLDEPAFRYVASRGFNLLVRAIGGVRSFADTQCGFKMFRREAAEDLFGRQRIDGFGFDIEILYIAQRSGMTVEEIGIDWRHDRGSKVRPVRDSLRTLSEVLRVRANHLLGRYHFSGSKAARSTESEE